MDANTQYYMIKEIYHLYEELRQRQPLKFEDQKRLDAKFTLEFNYNSNRLGGNALTYGQAKLLFMFGETSGTASLKDYEEMKAHNVGLEIIKQVAADAKRPLSEAFIRELNKTILVESHWKNAKTVVGESKPGEYKSRSNSVITATGEIFAYATPEETPAFMRDLVLWYNDAEATGELSSIELAALLHYRFIRIHPFDDGNGRIARLLVNYVLLRHHCPMVIIKSIDKENYLRVLHQCDVEVGFSPYSGAHAGIQKIQPFVDYMEKQLEDAFKMSLKAAKGESVEEEDDFDKKLALLEKEAKSKSKGLLMSKSDDAINWVIKDVLFKITDRITEKGESLKRFFNTIDVVFVLDNEEDFVTFTKSDIPLTDISHFTNLIFRLEASNPTDLLKPEASLSNSILIILDEDKYVYGFFEDSSYYGVIPPDWKIEKWIKDFTEQIYKDLEKQISEM